MIKWYVLNFQWVQKPTLPNGGHIYPKSFIDS